MTSIIPVILCGGSGTRLQPLSRPDLPKQFLTLGGTHSAFQNTVMRALRLTGVTSDRVVTVTSAALSSQAKKHLIDLDPGLATHLLAEPASRNTGPAIAWAARYTAGIFGPDALLWVLPSDHFIADETILGAALTDAVEAAKTGHLVTFGITPDRPETGYGYIKCGEPLASSHGLSVDRFVEKPDLATAESYLESGDYIWNSGMFLFSAATALESFRVHAPDILSAVESLNSYVTAPALSFDRAIMERSQNIAVLPCDPGWADIGSWTGLWETRARDQNGNHIIGQVEVHATQDCRIHGGSALVSCTGIHNLLVFETDDHILVAGRSGCDLMDVLLARPKTSGAAYHLGPDIIAGTGHPVLRDGHAPLWLSELSAPDTKKLPTL